MLRRSPPVGTLRVSALLAMMACTLVVPTMGLAQESLQEPVLRLCAEQANFPVSSRDRGGYDIDIAQLLAESLGVELEITWTGAQGQYVVETYLLAGECDFMMSVTEGAADLLNTVAYYQAPYVFVTRSDAPFEVTSLDDEVLRELRISTYPNSIPHRALVNRGLDGQVVFLAPIAGPRGTDRDTPILEALAAGEIDVAILYGPVAGNYATHVSTGLRIVPVSPEIDASLLPMYRILTMAVRPGAEALRDALNVALARRWNDIEAVLGEYGVPYTPLFAPTEQPRPEDELVVGLVLPLPTVLAKETDSAADSARVGARLAENVLAPGGDEGRHNLNIRVDNAPTVETAVQAAKRLIVFDGVSAIIGGIGDGQALALREVADEYGVPFLNIGSTDMTLRAAMCGDFTYHVEASAAMYLDALAIWYSEAGNRTWFLVGDDSERGRTLIDRARLAISNAEPTNEVVGVAVIPAGSFDQSDALDQVSVAGADVTLLLLPTVEQELFISQLAREPGIGTVAAFLEPSAQTREALLRRRQAAASLVPGPHFALWDATLEGEDSSELIERFTSRAGRPMEPSAWAAYAAVKGLSDAAAQLSSTDPGTIAEHLGSGDATFDLGKGVPLTIRRGDHQLVQPLYAVEIDREAQWGLELAGRLGLGRVIGQVPTMGGASGQMTPPLDLLGGAHSDLGCASGP